MRFLQILLIQHFKMLKKLIKILIRLMLSLSMSFIHVLGCSVTTVISVMLISGLTMEEQLNLVATFHPTLLVLVRMVEAIVTSPKVWWQEMVLWLSNAIVGKITEQRIVKANLYLWVIRRQILPEEHFFLKRHPVQNSLVLSKLTKEINF